MSKPFDLRKPAAAFDHDSTIVAAMELSGKSWIVAAAIPGVDRRPKKSTAAGNVEDVVAMIQVWRKEAGQAGKTINRVVITYEAGRDGFWIARDLIRHGFEVHVMDSTSIPLTRRARRVKTDKVDAELLLRTFLTWLRGEPGACSMVAIPTVEEEDARRPTRERLRLVADRLVLENQMESILVRFGVPMFEPRCRDPRPRLEAVRDRDGNPLPPNTMAELNRLLDRHVVIAGQIKEIETERNARVAREPTNESEKMIQLLMIIHGIAAETATILVYECLIRSFRNAKALGSFAGLTGTPYDSGGSKCEQGISKTGNPRLRLCLVQLAWRWLRLHPDHPFSRWFVERTAGAKGRIRKIMIVAVARKLLVMLWKLATTGLIPADVRLKAA